MDHGGKLPTPLTSEFTEICSEGPETTGCSANMANLSFLLMDGYIRVILRDPHARLDSVRSGYAVRSPLPEEGIGTVEIKSLFVD